MGQSQSSDNSHHVSKKELTHQLALKFSNKCFTPLEFDSFQEVFKGIADHQDGISFVKEEALAKFLEIPSILEVSPIVYRMLSYLGAFPLGQDAPVKLGFEELIMVVVIMTGRLEKVLGKGTRERSMLLFHSLAVHDWRQPDEKILEVEKNYLVPDPISTSPKVALGHTRDNIPDAEEKIIDDLSQAVLASLSIANVSEYRDASYLSQASIPPDHLKKFITLLLFMAPLGAQEIVSKHSQQLIGDRLEALQRTADSILAAFLIQEKAPGVKVHDFEAVHTTSLPFLFNSFNLLFEKFLLPKTIEFTTPTTLNTPTQPLDQLANQPMLPLNGEILEMNVLSQLSFFLSGSSVFHRLRLLYSGNEAGFSMGSFETHVFNWRAPTILLVSGFRIPESSLTGGKNSFTNTLPYKRFPDSSKSSRLVFGVYLTQHWRKTYKECFGDSDTLLFQLEPVHEIFHASSNNKDYVAFTRPPTSHEGISIGCPHPKPKQTTGLSLNASLGAVSLLIDSSFEFGIFTHDFTSGGGAFHASGTRKNNWQDQFEIDRLEVWGCGGKDEADQQKAMWQWEEREAEARRRINLGTGDAESDRALLEMAGIIGGNRSGGSMNEIQH